MENKQSDKSFDERYARQLRLKGFGREAQQKLANSKVVLVGCGGLGCPIALYLVSMGIGEIRITDPDTVQLSNLHRQILFTTADIGKSKVGVAAKKLKALNPRCKITTRQEYVRSSNVMEIIEDCDLVIDGSDNFPTRYLINDACYLKGIPLVYGAVNEFEGQVSIFNVLKVDGERSPHYRDLFPEPPMEGAVQNCAEAGVLGILPGIIGQFQAAEAVKYLTGIGENLIGKLLLFDYLTNTSTIIKYNSRKDVRITELVPIAPMACEEDEISWTDLKSIMGENTILIDVREEDEHNDRNAGGRNVPLARIEELSSLFNQGRTFVFYCQTGIRSGQAVAILKQKGFEGKFLHIKGGIVEYPFS